MRQKLRSLVVFALAFSLICFTSVKASPHGRDDDKAAAKVKSALIKLGTGPYARVELTLRDKTKLRGYVHELGDDSLTVVEDETETITQVPYQQVQKVKGKNYLTGDTIFAIVIVAALLAIIGGQVIAHHGDF